MIHDLNRIGHSSRTKELFMSAISNFQFIKPEHWLFQDYGVVANARAQAENTRERMDRLKVPNIRLRNLSDNGFSKD